MEAKEGCRMTDKELRESSVRFKHLVRLLEFCVAFALVLNGVLFFTVITHKTWDPLDVYPIQIVTNATETSVDTAGRVASSPTVHVPADTEVPWPTVNITAIKCADEEVTVKGSSYWRQVEPPGFTYANQPGIATRSLGCQTFNYRNDIPKDVRLRIAEIAKSGVTKTIWQIGGEEIPVNESGETGGIRLYQSQNFTVVYG